MQESACLQCYHFVLCPVVMVKDSQLYMSPVLIAEMPYANIPCDQAITWPYVSHLSMK